MSRQKATFSSDFYCTKCGKKTIPLARKVCMTREKGHLKKLYCYHCKREVNCVEVRGFGEYTIEDFRFEFDNKNFDETGNRVLSYGEFRAKMYDAGHDLP